LQNQVLKKQYKRLIMQRVLDHKKCHLWLVCEIRVIFFVLI
jgi:hypothetical protein